MRGPAERGLLVTTAALVDKLLDVGNICFRVNAEMRSRSPDPILFEGLKKITGPHRGAC